MLSWSDCSKNKRKKIRVLLVPFLFLGLARNLYKLLPQFDVVHAHWIIPQGIVHSFFKKKYIVTGHGGDITEFNTGIFRVLKKRVLNNASYVSVVSSKAKEFLEKEYGITNAVVQSMGCDVDKFSPNKRVENYFNQGDKKVLLFVGRFVEIKGISYLIEAMKSIDAYLVIVGKGPIETKLKEQASKVSAERIVFLGAQDHETLPTIYASSDIFVIPSITIGDGVTEGAPTVITEALASGLPVIGTNTGGIPEMIKDNINGFIVEERDSTILAEKINFLLDNPLVLQEFSKNARNSGLEKSYSNVAKVFRDLLEKLVE